MNSVMTNQLSHDFESAYSEILPDLYQLLQHYQVSISSAITIHSCVWCNGSTYCYPNMPPPPCPRPRPFDGPEELGLDIEKTQQFYTDVDSKFSTISPRLNQAVQQMDESFEIHFLIDPATDSNSHAICRFVDGILICSPQP
jgi:hypothetical protein